MCGQMMYDYVLGMCYFVPCEFSYVSMNYFEKLIELGILVGKSGAVG